ncbi:hypothetical protein N7509_003854, partial [Penicillium cosmopolitanum]
REVSATRKTQSPICLLVPLAGIRPADHPQRVRGLDLDLPVLARTRVREVPLGHLHLHEAELDRAVVAKTVDATEAEAEATVDHPVGPRVQRKAPSFGDIEYLDLPVNRAFMTNRGTAYILYYDPADAEAAIAHMHEAQLDGAVLNVAIVLPRRTFSRSPPPANRDRGNGGRSGFRRGSYAKSPPRRQGRGARPGERHDVYRPKSVSRSRSRSPVRNRSYSRSRSRSPPRRGSTRPKGSGQRRRRSPSYSSYDDSSRGGRTPTSDRTRSRNRH